MSLPCLPVLLALLWFIFKISCLPAISGQFWCLHLSFSGTCLLLYLGCQTSNSKWFFLVLLRFQDYSSMFWYLQLGLAFPAGPCLSSNPQVNFLLHHNLLLDVVNQKVFCSSSPGSPTIMLNSSLTPSSHTQLSSPLQSVYPTCS